MFGQKFFLKMTERLSNITWNVFQRNSPLEKCKAVYRGFCRVPYILRMNASASMSSLADALQIAHRGRRSRIRRTARRKGERTYSSEPDDDFKPLGHWCGLS